MSESLEILDSPKVSEQTQENYGYMPHLHRCRRCHRFFRGCRCNRRMYRRYRKSSCVCKAVFSLLICALSSWILYKVAMYIYYSPILQTQVFAQK